ncbi:MAG: type IX secretion system membrane protein PorP/SprF, partial [Chryseolinea sp.]
MKKVLLLSGFLLVMLSLSAQNRRYMSSFQLFPSYYNPAMTGFSGNNISASYRSSRWTEFEGAPKTYFMSGDFNIKKHAFGFAFLHDSFGPYRESEALINYGFHINLSRTLQLDSLGHPEVRWHL